MGLGFELNDFILIGEFCEMYGPSSVLTLPSTIGKHTNNNSHFFNLEEFLLYIMTTDYQNFSGDKLEEVFDVSCIRANILPNVHAVLHYFTLKDPQARGCVRPSCVAYVSQNLKKLYTFKDNILRVLNMSAQILKHSNAKWMKSQDQAVQITENPIIYSLLHKFSHLTQPFCTNDQSKLGPWTGLCSEGIHLAVSGLLQMLKVFSRPLEEQVLDPKSVSINYDLFDTVDINDKEFVSIMKSLN